MSIRKWPERIAQYFGAHTVPLRADHELDRAMQRGVVVSMVCLLWLGEHVVRGGVWPRDKLLLLMAGMAYAAGSFVFYTFVRRHPAGGVFLQYLFLVGDPIFLVLALLVDAETLAFLYPFLFLVIIRSGIRYGTRTMWLAWAVTLATAGTLLPLSPYWRQETQLTLSFLLLLALIPVFFLSLIDAAEHAAARSADARARPGRPPGHASRAVRGLLAGRRRGPRRTRCSEGKRASS